MIYFVLNAILRLRPYISVFVVLLLVAAPWLQTDLSAGAQQEEMYCTCCQGPCQGCCCAEQPSDSESPSPESTEMTCHCGLSSVRVPVHEPDDAVLLHSDHHKLVSPSTDYCRPIVNTEKPDQSFAVDHFPPEASPRPLFVLNSSFLI